MWVFEMPLLREEDREYLRKEFEKILKDKVKVLGFVKGEDCKYCKETKELLEEVASLSDKIELVFPESGEEYGIEEVPVVVVQDEEGELGTRVRFLGIPSGYEFTSLVKDIMYVSTKTLEISESTIEELQSIENEILIEVYVTPSCPYCPRAVLLAHQFAMVSEKITGVMVESYEFPAKADEWNVMSVPHTVVRNIEKGSVGEFIGAYPESYLLKVVKDVDAGKDVKLS